MISRLPYSTYLYLDFHLLSRRWLLHTGGSKMFEPLFHAGMSVFDQFVCRIYISAEKMRIRNQKLINWSGKHAKNTQFSKNFSKRASLKSGIPEMCHLKSRIPEMGQLNSGIPELSYHKLRIPEMSQLNSGIPEMCYLIWAGTFREFLIWGGKFQEFLIWDWPFYENFLENCVFGIFLTSMNQFLASNSHFFRWHVCFAKKKMAKNDQSCVK